MNNQKSKRESRSKILMKEWELYEHSTCNDKDTKTIPLFDTYFFHLNITKKLMELVTYH